MCFPLMCPQVVRMVVDVGSTRGMAEDETNRALCSCWRSRDRRDPEFADHLALGEASKEA